MSSEGARAPGGAMTTWLRKRSSTWRPKDASVGHTTSWTTVALAPVPVEVEGSRVVLSVVVPSVVVPVVVVDAAVKFHICQGE